MTIKVQGATISVGATAIGGVKSISGFDGEASEIDTTDLDSVAKEYDLGLQDFGSFNLTWNTDYSDAGQSALRSAQASGTVQSFTIVFASGEEAAFSGIVKNAQNISGGVDANLEGGANIRISGAVTITP